MHENLIMVALHMLQIMKQEHRKLVKLTETHPDPKVNEGQQLKQSDADRRGAS